MSRKTVALDLDGVLAYFDHWEGPDHFGEPIPGAVDFTKELAKHYDIIVNTCRCNTKLNRIGANLLERYVSDWLDKHGFIYHEIYSSQGKPHADAYIDDRAVTCRPEYDKEAYIKALDQVRRLSPAPGPDSEFELQIESHDIKAKSRTTICTCTPPVISGDGPCQRCGKPLTLDYETIGTTEKNWDVIKENWNT